MKEFITFLIKQLVNNSDAVVITENIEGSTHIYKIDVAPEDMGIVIGRDGKTINSIRNLVKAKAIKDNIMIQIVLNEKDGVAQPQVAQEKADAND